MPSRVTRNVTTRVRSAWNATVIMSVISLKCSAKSLGTPYGLSMPGSTCAFCCSARAQLLLNLADRAQILVQLALIGGTEAAAQRARVLGDEVEDAAPVHLPPRPRLGCQLRAVAEQPLEERTRIEDRRQRLRLAAPREVVRVRARVARIAVASLARVLQPDFERREPRLPADLIRDQLIAGDTCLDVGDGLLHLHAGEVRPAAAPVIARAVEQRAPGVVGEVAHQQDVVLERLERLQRLRKHAEPAFVARVPVPHVDAVRHVDERHAHGRLAALRARERGRHRVEERQGNGGAQAAQKRSSWKRLACDEHQRAPSTSSPRRDWNGRLLTI